MDTKETVLVVDDDREIVGAIALALEKRATGCCVPMTAWRPWTTPWTRSGG